MWLCFCSGIVIYDFLYTMSNKKTHPVRARHWFISPVPVFSTGEFVLVTDFHDFIGGTCPVNYEKNWTPTHL